MSGSQYDPFPNFYASRVWQIIKLLPAGSALGASDAIARLETRINRLMENDAWAGTANGAISDVQAQVAAVQPHLRAAVAFESLCALLARDEDPEDELVKFVFGR